MKPQPQKTDEPFSKTSRPSRTTTKPKPIISDSQAMKILEQTQRLLASNDTLETINLLRALRDNMSGVKNQQLQIVTLVNLGVLYYQVGFLEEAQMDLSEAITRLKQQCGKMIGLRSKDLLRLRHETMLGRIQLQLCILHSELGKHDMALEQAKMAVRTHYSLIYDLLARLHYNLNKALSTTKPQLKPTQPLPIPPNHTQLLNYIVTLTQLLHSTPDLKAGMAQKQKLSILQQQCSITKKYGVLPTKPDIGMLYNIQPQAEHLWVFKNKILDQIQMNTYQMNQFEIDTAQITKDQVISKIAFLAISLYCYSTQTRFMEKEKSNQTHTVLQSEHWLSRSLEIAYSFMPPEAPILNQILTVHQRFHSLDKQTIPQDQEVAGFFKVLKPLSKPSTLYTPKSVGNSPIVIRIQADLMLDDHPPTPIPRGKTLQIGILQHRKTLDAIGKHPPHPRHHSHHNQREDGQGSGRKVSSHTTIDNPMNTHTGNIRSQFTNKKFHRREPRIKSNYSQLNGKAIISEDLLMRPHSYDTVPEAKGHVRSQSEGKKKTASFRRRDPPKRPNSYGATIKLQGGLQLQGHGLTDTIQQDFFQRLHQESKVIESSRLGGNVYINNNINLYISKHPDSNSFGQTYVRGQILSPREQQLSGRQEGRQQQGGKQMSRRQMFMNKRKTHNYMMPVDL